MSKRLDNNDRSDEKSGRNAIIYKKKKNGTPAVDIAKEFGLSAPRIHRICLKEENKELKLENEKLKRQLYFKGELKDEQ